LRDQEGERNHGLFWAACKMAEQMVPNSEALDALSAAAEQAGLSQREAATTVRSAYRAVQVHLRSDRYTPTQKRRVIAHRPRHAHGHWHE
jgi:hypothetical protein